MRWLVGLGLLGVVSLASACTSLDDTPTISIGRGSNDLQIEYVRPYGHHFDAINLTVNGLVVAPASIDEGSKGQSFKYPDTPARATFTTPVAAIDRAVDIELTEGGEQFAIEVPDFAAPRAIHLHTPVDALRADDWIELDSGVTSDALIGNFEVTLNDSYCFSSQGNKTPAPGTVAIKMGPAGQNNCGPTDPPAGSTQAVNLELDVYVTAAMSRCDGPDLVCNPINLPALIENLPATLQY